MLGQIAFLNDLPPELRSLVLRLLALVLALLVIWLLRRFLTLFLIRPLRHIFERTSNRADEIILDAAIMPMRLVIIALALFISAMIFEVDAEFIARIVRTLIILAVLMLINGVIDILLPTSTRLFSITGITLEERLLPFVRVAARLILISLGIVIVLQEWGYDISGVVAGIGLGGLAFSLAAQDTLANLFGFAAIVGDRPFNMGDYIKTPDVEGLVEHVGLRSTRVRQLDQALVMVPNNKLANSAILNWSRLAKRRIDYVLGVTYGTNSDQMRVLLDKLRIMFKEQPTVEADTTVINFIDFGPSSLDILIRAYVKITDWGEFTREKERLHLLVMDSVRECGLSIAFPSQSLYIENLSELGSPSRIENHPELSPREQAILHEMRNKPMPYGDDAPEK